MPTISLEILNEHLKKFEQDLELSKAHLYRIDGAIQILKQLISLSEIEEAPKDHAESTRLP